MKKLLSVVLSVCLICALLAGCSGTTNTETTSADETTATIAETTAAASTYDGYVGNQYYAEDPWGGDVYVTVRSVTEDTIDWAYTDVLGDITIYAEDSTTLEDGLTNFTIEGETENNYTYTYTGTFVLKDGYIVIKYLDGAVTSGSENGGGSSYQVAALADSEKIITLDKSPEDNTSSNIVL